MSELIEQLEHATEGNAELDRAVGEATCRGYFDQPCLGAYDFTRSIDTAASLIPLGWSWRVGVSERHTFAFVALGRSYPTNANVNVEARTPAIALCIAALKLRNIP